MKAKFPVGKLLFSSQLTCVLSKLLLFDAFASVGRGMVTTYSSKQSGREINMLIWGNKVFELCSPSSQLQVELLFRKLDMKLLQQVKSDLLFRSKASLLKMKESWAQTRNTHPAGVVLKV